MHYTSSDLRQKYLDFFKSKNHAIIPSAPLVPENDASVLFNTAGMQPLVPYLLGEKHPMGTRLTDAQKCVRTGDIDDVGDDSHCTFFEMLGNWSLGDYFKKESIAFSWEFLTDLDWLGLDPKMISVTVFEGDENAPRDEESADIWAGLGMSRERIAYLCAEDNWWAVGPTGPCGPDTEIFYWVGTGEPQGNKGTHPDDWMEIWNNVFMQYIKRSEEETAEEIKKKIDDITGKIIGLAIDIHKKYHNTLTERQIHDMLFDKIQAIGLKVEKEKQIDVIEDGKKYGSRRIDLVVENTIFIELKNNSNTAEIKKGFLQTRSYLELGNGIAGLLLNFAFETLDITRFNHFAGNAYSELLQTSQISLLPQLNVDTGMGLERTLAVINGKKTVYETDLFENTLEHIKRIVGVENYNERGARIIADHIRTAVHMIADGVKPSNTDRGYILRRLIRRAIREAHKMGHEDACLAQVARDFIRLYENVYESIKNNEAVIIDEISMEEAKFQKTIKNGLRELAKLQSIDGKEAFGLFETYGLPFEMIRDEIIGNGGSLPTNFETDFNTAMVAHQDLSRTASAGMFKGGLADHSEITVQLHTACHLMLAGLRKVLGNHVMQAGSNITPERLRFDFTHPEKMTPEQIAAVEEFVNSALKSHITVTMNEESKESAKARGVLGAFWEKYPDTVKVYTMIGDDGTVYSEELCGGPHIEESSTMGTFKIQKEEASSAGVRRIKAILN